MSDNNPTIHLVGTGTELSLHRTTTRSMMKLRHKQVAIKAMAKSILVKISGEEGELTQQTMMDIVELAEALLETAEESADGMIHLCDCLNTSTERLGSHK